MEIDLRWRRLSKRGKGKGAENFQYRVSKKGEWISWSTVCGWLIFERTWNCRCWGPATKTRLNGHFSIIRHVTGDPYFDTNGLNVRNYFFRCCNNYSIFCQWYPEERKRRQRWFTVQYIYNSFPLFFAFPSPWFNAPIWCLDGEYSHIPPFPPPSFVAKWRH